MKSNKKRIKTALEKFMKNGDLNTLLHKIAGDDDESNPLAVLQHALQTVEDPKLRDTIDHVAWAVANECPVSIKPPKEKLDRIEKAAVREYGPSISGVLPEMRDFASDILSSNEPQMDSPPTVNAVAAAIGLKARGKSVPIGVSPDDAGGEKQFFSTDCEKCGGAENGMGYLTCDRCCERARKDCGEGILREHLLKDFSKMYPERMGQIDLAATLANIMPDMERHIDLDAIPMGMIKDTIDNNPGKYGCSVCRNEPVKECTCSMRVKIPEELKNNWITEGIRPATGETFYAVLLVEQK